MLTAGVVLAKVLSTDVPVRIVSLDLSKAFDRIDWAKLDDAMFLPSSTWPRPNWNGLEYRFSKLSRLETRMHSESLTFNFCP